ncbi:MAG: MlaD family protein [Sphingomonadaceae bacterium]|nr:MCE family protein [Sphingomonadaceae bacterium]
METRANHVWVGVVTLALLGAAAAFFVWLAGLSAGSQKDYDILFKQSVAGLTKGSQVSFAGVPVGQVDDIELWEKDPDYVRVRISVDEDVPILVGTTATVQSSFTGVSTIMLDGARADAPPITCETTACPQGVPVIPPKAGGLGELLANAPLLLERLATVTERLDMLMSDENLANLSGILENSNRMSRNLADASPQVEGTLKELQVTLKEAGEALDAFEKVMGSTDTLINEEGKSMAVQLRETLKSANAAALSLSKTLDSAEPAARRLNTETLPAAEASLRELRAASKALRDVTEKIENQGAGSIIKGQSLPDYEP